MEYLGSPSGELPEGERGLRRGIACKCWVIDSIRPFNIIHYTAGMPLLPSALPPKGEASRYDANSDYICMSIEGPLNRNTQYQSLVTSH